MRIHEKTWMYIIKRTDQIAVCPFYLMFEFSKHRGNAIHDNDYTEYNDGETDPMIAERFFEEIEWISRVCIHKEHKILIENEIKSESEYSKCG